MKRVIINSSGLRVSKAGYDASTATGAELSLDTRSGKYFSIFLQGSIPLSSFTGASLGGSNYQWTYTLNFGTTFAAPPIVALTCQDPIQTDGTCVTQVYANDQVAVVFGGVSFSYATGGGAATSSTTTSSSLTITVTKYDYTYNAPVPAFVNYTVFRTS